MNHAPTLALTAMVAASVFPACSPPRAPNGETAAAEADAGELTCDERLRAEVLCQSAIRQRCDSREHDCESSCEPGAQPGAGLTQLPFITDIDVTRCHDNCRQVHEGCEHSVAQHCPTKCD